MRRVLVLSGYFPDTTRPSRGIFVLEQAEKLAKIAHVTVISPVAVPLPRKKFRRIRETISRIPHHSSLNGVNCFRPRYFDFPRLGNYLNAYAIFLSVWRCISRNNIEIDLIHAHFAHEMGYVGVLLSKWLSKPFILTVHGSDINIRPQFVPDRKRISVALRNSNRVIAVSNDLKAKVLTMGVQPDKVVVIGNGVDTMQFKPMDKFMARSRLGFPAREPVVLSVANLNEVKGIHYLIKAFSQLCGRKQWLLLAIVGAGSMRPELEAEVKSLGLANSTCFVGERPHDEIPLWMNACDVFVLPSLNEGFGIVLLEALACGRPVVATRVGGIPELIKDGSVGLLVEPANSRALAEAMRNAITMKWDTEKMIRYATDYSWSKAAQKIYEEYESVL